MEDISFSLLNLDDNLINVLENMRYDAYSINLSSDISSFYKFNLNHGNFVAFGVYYQNQLVGACYVSKTYSSLYVEQLFILKKYQNTNLHLGSELLKYVLNQKEYVDNYFNINAKYSYIENSIDSHLYERLGYKEVTEFLMRKKL